MDKETSYMILRNCIDPKHVQRARGSLIETLKEKRLSVKKDVVFVNIFEKFEDWPEECKALFLEIKVSNSNFMPRLLNWLKQRVLPFGKYLPSGSYRVDSLIGIYQPNKLKGRGPEKSYFYTVGLDETVGTHNGMPEYIQGSHEIHDQKVLNSLPRPQEPLRLEEGDVLVWNGETAFESLGKGDSSFMLIKLSFS